ncbi:hypothetical protein ZIOFF_018930 [Zingiber officinale]|uniref:Transmembrane protein n=1 Tax=Zingiber officinale TaxID=94328 RepID=A0A8J5H8W8_ZINOF|nr:hypothetical protein ZIOFF_018930 [Zingiber officinale]
MRQQSRSHSCALLLTILIVLIIAASTFQGAYAARPQPVFKGGMAQFKNTYENTNSTGGMWSAMTSGPSPKGPGTSKDGNQHGKLGIRARNVTTVRKKVGPSASAPRQKQGGTLVGSDGRHCPVRRRFLAPGKLGQLQKRKLLKSGSLGVEEGGGGNGLNVAGAFLISAAERAFNPN